VSAIPTVKDVVESHEGADKDALIAALIEREDQIADHLRVAGAQLGTFPEFVAKVLADTGLGTPVDAETKMLLNRQFTERLAWLQEQFRDNG
jgi:hypothetical protein